MMHCYLVACTNLFGLISLDSDIKVAAMNYVFFLLAKTFKVTNAVAIPDSNLALNVSLSKINACAHI